MKVPINASIPKDLRNRSRAAYRSTQHLENDESYSDFISKAIAAEVSRREALHNGGQKYAGGEKPLSAGRPLRN